MRLANSNQILYWMMTNNSLWKDWPYVLPDYEAWLQHFFGGPRPDGPMPKEVEPITDTIRKNCVAGLQKAGLISLRTGWRDVSVERHIVRIRKMWGWQGRRGQLL